MLTFLKKMWGAPKSGKVVKKQHVHPGNVTSGAPHWVEGELKWSSVKRQEAYVLVLDNGTRLPVSLAIYQKTNIGDVVTIP